MPRIPILGGAYSAKSFNASAQRSVNLIPEENPQRSQSPAQVTHYPRPGRTPLGAPPQPGSGRCCYVATNGNLYVVVDQTVYSVSVDFIFTAIGNLVSTGTNPCYMADNGTTAVLVTPTAPTEPASWSAAETSVA